MTPVHASIARRKRIVTGQPIPGRIPDPTGSDRWNRRRNPVTTVSAGRACPEIRIDPDRTRVQGTLSTRERARQRLLTAHAPVQATAAQPFPPGQALREEQPSIRRRMAESPAGRELPRLAEPWEQGPDRGRKRGTGSTGIPHWIPAPAKWSSGARPHNPTARTMCLPGPDNPVRSDEGWRPGGRTSFA